MAKPKRIHTDTTLKLPSDFAATVKALLQTPPPPRDVPGSRVGIKAKRRRAKRGNAT
jgi:hypothetical protein